MWTTKPPLSYLIGWVEAGHAWLINIARLRFYMHFGFGKKITHSNSFSNNFIIREYVLVARLFANFLRIKRSRWNVTCLAEEVRTFTCDSPTVGIEVLVLIIRQRTLYARPLCLAYISQDPRKSFNRIINIVVAFLTEEYAKLRVAE